MRSRLAQGADKASFELPAESGDLIPRPGRSRTLKHAFAPLPGAVSTNVTSSRRPHRPLTLISTRYVPGRTTLPRAKREMSTPLSSPRPNSPELKLTSAGAAGDGSGEAGAAGAMQGAATEPIGKSARRHAVSAR